MMTPTLMNANKVYIHSPSKAKVTPSIPKATMQRPEAKPSIPSIRLMALVMKTVSSRVSGTPTKAGISYRPNSP